MSKATLIATLMAVVSAFSSPAKAQAPLKTKPSAKSDQPTYMITAHTIIHDNSTIQRDNYVVVYGSEVLRVQYSGSHIDTPKPGASELENEMNIQQHTSYGSGPFGPDLSEVPQIGVAIRACEMDTKYPETDPRSGIAIHQSVSTPCMHRVADTLRYELAVNGGPKKYDDVIFDILEVTKNVGVVAAQLAPPRKDIPAIAIAANGVVVSIITSDKGDKPVARGTGFLVSTDGRIVTNYHVIKGASSAIVKLPDGAFYDVDGVVAFDKARDLAVIKAHGQNFPVVTLGDSDRVQVGEEIVAIGSPLSLESTVSSGIVSGIRTIKEEGGKFLQITAPISPGSSGGPLFNMEGEVVGITTLYLEGGENLNFAIPINDAKSLVSADSKVQDFQVETEASRSETHAEAAPSPSVSPTTARAFYKQLYDVGGFSLDTRVYSVFVCFNDDPSLQWFFTFNITAYDERYTKAFKAHVQALLDKTDDSGPWSTMRSIESFNPDVDFLDEDFGLAFADVGFGAGTEAYLRSGGRVLTYTPYDRGVKIGSLYYRGTGNLWTLEDKPSNPLIQTEKTSLSFEPNTLRYVMRLVMTFTDGNIVAKDVVSGMCEKIPSPVKKNN
jgi:hypothetical protein